MITTPGLAALSGGIASSNFSWRGEASPAVLEPPYHSPEDTVAKNISPERVQVSLELIGSALYEQARTVRPRHPGAQGA